MPRRPCEPATVPVRDARRLLLAGCSLDRAHHLILHARLDGYAPAHLAHHTEVSRLAFEHWTHDASVIRSDPYRLYTDARSTIRPVSGASSSRIRAVYRCTARG